MLIRFLIIVALAFPAAAQSQQAAERVSTEQTLPGLGSRVRVRAEGIFGGPQTGTVIRRSGDTLTLAIKGDDPVAVPLARMSSLETSAGISRRRGAVRGALILGAVITSLVALEGQFTSERCVLSTNPSCTAEVPGKRGASATAMTRGLVYGVSFGSILGLFWPTESWHPVIRR